MENKFNVVLDVSINVDESTAFRCLRILEMYINRNGKHIEELKNDKGEIELGFTGGLWRE